LYDDVFEDLQSLINRSQLFLFANLIFISIEFDENDLRT
jgi:hypothetical protein